MSRDFNGSNANYLGAGDAAPLSITPEITGACWLRPNALGGEQTLLGKWGNQYLLETNGAGIMAATFNGGYEIATGGIALTNGVWHHAAFRRTASALRVFANGAPDTQVAASGGIPYHSGSFIVGMKTNQSSVFNGRIAEGAVWDVALSDAEIMALAKGVCPSMIRVQNLRGYWPMQAVVPAGTEADLGGEVATLGLAGSVPYAAHAPVGRFSGMTSG